MDSTILEKLIATLMDKTFERLQVKDRVEQVTICVGDPLFLQATIKDGTSSQRLRQGSPVHLWQGGIAASY